MENYGYDPYRYPYQPPPPANPSPHFPPPQQPPYPYNPYHHSSGGSSPPPDPYLSHPAQYPPPPPPPQYYAPPYPSYPSLYPSYQYPNPSAPDLSPNSPPPPPPPSSYQPCRPGHYPHHSGEFYASPPPHSDPFHPSYGQPGAPFEPTPPHHDAEPVNPNLSVAPHEVAYPPIEGMLANVHLSDHTSSSAPATPSLSKPSASFHHRPNNSFSGFSPHTATPSSATTPFSWSQHGGQNASFGHGGSSSNDMQIVPFQPSNTSLKVLLLHGNLDIWIHEARNLPNMDMFSKTLTDFFGRKPPGKLDGSHGHNSHVPSMTSDPYVSFSVTTAVLGRTYVISNSENPVWNQHFYVAVAHHAAEVHFVVKDSDVVGAQLIGTVAIPAEHIYGGAKVAGVYPILGANGKPCKPGATLRLSIQYIPIEMLSMYHNGVGPGPEYIGVPGTYFPLRQGGRVKLYSDAHAPDGCLPDLWLDEGVRYEHGKCWQDMTKAIREARRLIYITGWSVYHKVRLVRDVVNESNWTLGDLLKAKSQEGVRVLLLVWDDPTSRNIFGYQKDGVMQTHDEETRRFFKHSSVNVLLTPRSAGKRHSWMKQQEVGIIYTHHQKIVIVDSDAGYNRRKIVAFVGGLDLCDGRYDTPDHSLFRTLHTLHKDDYHNPTFLATDVGGPREPWHDLHTRIDGPAAYDVLKNFEERWLKAKRPHGIKKLKPCDDALLLIDRIPDILKIDESPYVNDYDPESWHVQIFRSIDSNSVKGFPKNPAEATSKNLVCGKNVLIDMSIHTAYVKAIRAAQHFIYIENQYFLGSSYNWTAHKDLGANNLIPMEIALKIASKIKSHERFSVYIVIPMWPEGVPTGVATQRILYWQNKTMQMMYETIYKALVEVGLENSYVPQDYLNFFCLGNREVQDGNFSSGNPTAANSPSVLALKNRRFMIYVHSKGMIVDDEYLIVGSANINQRSLEGTRDSEIAMGAYQPQHTWARKLYHPHGQIYGFRMSLWAEHIGFLEELFEHPEGLECMRRVRTLGELNWQQFVANEVIEMRGHLLKYPVDVDRQGKVRPLPGCETFPDVGGNICGSFSMVQENLTI